MEKFLSFVCGFITALCLVMVYVHRRVIQAMITGEEMPEVPENCPVSKCDKCE